MGKYTEEWLRDFKNTFKYNEATGDIVYKDYYFGNFPGTVAGSVCVRGYRNGVPSGYIIRISFKRKQILAHRAAVFLKEGYLPDDSILIDHEDRDSLNNKWTNIRIATKAQNAQNAKLPIHNTTGVKGVSITKTGKYRAEIIVDGKLHLLGCSFPTLQEAETVIKEARINLHKEFACHG